MTRTPEQLAADTIRALSIDAIQKANSGHPGMPMGMADIGVVVWSKFLKVDPSDPTWVDRDRFVLSNGHGSMLLYSLLHLAGFPLPMEQIENFRQWGYETAGHPEVANEIGIDTTTGPLGQGFGTAVGMAVAEAHLRAIHGEGLVDHRTWMFCGDGDLMEGVASEAASMAGHLGLGRLVAIYDDNSITIDGTTDITFSEDVPKRFEAYGWQTITVDGHDREAIAAAIDEAVSDEDRPTLISCKTHIAYGSPNKIDTSGAHGSPMGADEIALIKEGMGWELPPFNVPDEVYALFAKGMQRGKDANAAWKARYDAADTASFDAYLNPGPVALSTPDVEAGFSVAPRQLSEAVIQELADLRPDVMGGSADLTPSNLTGMSSTSDFSADNPAGRYLRYGIREHGMGAIMNGITQHGGLRAFGATFFTFSDYVRPSVRLAALMGVPVIHVWTHDSFLLGEDGPTHQSIEHLESLRAMPGLHLWRPADAAEVAASWSAAINRTDGPTGLVVSKVGLPVRSVMADAETIAKGGYIKVDGTDAVIIATGSEVSIAEDAATLLAGEDTSVRVVSLPCVEVFEAQDDEYREEVLGSDLPVFTVEAGTTGGLARYVANGGVGMGIDHFGASAPAEVLAEKFGFTPDAVANTIRATLG